MTSADIPHVFPAIGITLSPIAREYLAGILLLLGALVLAWLARWVMHVLLRRLTARTETTLDDTLVQGLSRPVFWFILIMGMLSTLLSLSSLTAFHAFFIRGYSVVTIVFGIVVTLQFTAVMIAWTFGRLATRIGDTAMHYAGLTRKICAVAIWFIGSMIVLAQLGIQITPLVTTLGLSSLAVALALQDTLGNFFAGIYLMLDRPIKVGDYVRLESGEEGFVDAIGWRSTRIRLWSNYIVVLPNSKLTSSTITNLVLNQSETAVYIHGGVGYLNDLDHVERVLRVVAREVLIRVEGACADVEPLVRFQEFGDSNITFLVILKVQDFSVQYVLKHEFVKAVHRRFREEEIEIAWPVRQLVAAHPIPVIQVSATDENDQRQSMPR
ncbi:MAG: mechanosensitive ion channel family protein [Armatimonadota bacterium]